MIEKNTINVGGVDIHYAQKNERAAYTVFFLHGNSSSHNTWAHQFDDDKLAGYRLIAFDLPAHGASGIMQQYTLPAIGKIMAADLLK